MNRFVAVTTMRMVSVARGFVVAALVLVSVCSLCTGASCRLDLVFTVDVQSFPVSGTSTFTCGY